MQNKLKTQKDLGVGQKVKHLPSKHKAEFKPQTMKRKKKNQQE
jgi:hypothetical protein